MCSSDLPQQLTELLGASRTLRKPFELGELLRAVGELLEEPSPGT